MSLTKLEGARIFSNGFLIDTTVEYMTTNWARRRYGPGAQVNDPRGVGHIGVSAPELAQDALNKAIDEGTLPKKAMDVLLSFGFEGDLEDLDWNDIHFLRSTNGYSAARVMLDAIRAEAPPAPTPTPEPPPVNNYPGAPPLTGPGNVYERIALYGLIMASTPQKGPLPSQDGLALRYYANKLIPGVNEEQWMLDNRGLRPLPEQWPVREDGIYLYDQLELRIAEWGMALAEGQSGAADRQKVALDAYWAFEEAFVPKSDQGAPPAYGDRVANPRSVLYAGRMIENAIVKGLPNSAAWCGPRCAFTLGMPRHLSRYEGWGFSSQPLQSRDWRSVLGIPITDGGGGSGGSFPGGPQ